MFPPPKRERINATRPKR